MTWPALNAHMHASAHTAALLHCLPQSTTFPFSLAHCSMEVHIRDDTHHTWTAQAQTLRNPQPPPHHA